MNIAVIRLFIVAKNRCVGMWEMWEQKNNTYKGIKKNLYSHIFFLSIGNGIKSSHIPTNSKNRCSATTFLWEHTSHILPHFPHLTQRIIFNETT